MPYFIKEIIGATGYKRWKVCKKGNMNKCFSKEPLTKTRAQAQMKALYASENNPRGKLIVILIKKHNFPEEEVKNEVGKLSNKEAKTVLENLN